MENVILNAHFNNLTAVSDTFSILENTINSYGHWVHSEIEIIHTSVIWDEASMYKFFRGITFKTLLFTDSSDHIIVHTFSTIHWRLETDHS